MSVFDQAKPPESRTPKRFVILAWSVIPLFVSLFWLWLHFNLPLPLSLLDRLHFWNEGGQFDGVIFWREGRIKNNFDRRTHALNLVGTRWHDPDTNATIEFSENNVIRWITRPSTGNAASFSMGQLKTIDWLDEAPFIVRHNTPFAFYWDIDSISVDSLDGNLVVDCPGEVKAGYGFDGWTLGLWIRGPDFPIVVPDPSALPPLNRPRDIYLFFEEQRD